MKSIKFELTAYQIKWIAAIAMVIDHIGYFLLPNITWLRVIGRLSYPVFAYFIVEGCINTKNRTKRFFRVFLLGLLCFIVSALMTDMIYGNILLTFSCSIILIYAVLDIVKYMQKHNAIAVLLLLLMTIFLLGAIKELCRCMPMDYGYVGIMIPVWLAVAKTCPVKFIAQNKYIHIVVFEIGLIFLAWSMGGYQWFALAAPALFMFYNGKKGGRANFFYWFYPLHIVVIEGIDLALGLLF